MRTNPIAILASSIVFAAALSSCSRAKHTYQGLSAGEVKVLQENPFGDDGSGDHADGDQGHSAFDPTTVASGIEGEQNSTRWKNEDSLFPVNEPAACTMEPPKFIHHCDPALYETELKEAMEAAAADPDKKTIVVRYSVSLGTPLDDVAFTAYNRTILRSNDDGVTPIPVGPAEGLDYNDWYGSRAFHYFTDHVIARNQYVAGEKCYFSTVKIYADETGPVMHTTGGVEHSLPGDPDSGKFYDHTMNILYYGDSYPCTGAQDCYRRYLSPRLFKRNDQVTDDIARLLEDFRTNNLQNLKLSEFVRQCPGDHQPQIIPLYVADFREQRLADENMGKLINREFSNSAVRRYEYEVKLKKIFDLRNMFLNREKMAKAWWEAKTISGYCFSPYIGVAQLIDNMIFGGTNGTVLSTQYTPIVLDLPIGDTSGGYTSEYEQNRHIHTSSVEWGTFFNLLNLMWKKPSGELADIHHLTAWVGGRLVHRDPATDGVTTSSCGGGSCTYPPTGSLHLTREATDGFLVIPKVATDSTGAPLACGDGSPMYEVPRGENLFGSYAEVNGHPTAYNNGFQKLRDWIGTHGGIPKTCTGMETCNTPITADQMKSRYFGPWDGTAWSAVKVWLDKNRDGKVDCGEIMSLTEAKIAALNTCQFEYRTLENGELEPSKDKFGNATHLRAAFLVDETGTGLSEQETLKRLQTGLKAPNQPAEFRIAIDVLFNSRPGLFLEDAPDDQVVPLASLTDPQLP